VTVGSASCRTGPRRTRRDAGSATIVVLALASLLIVVAAFGAARATAVLSRHQLGRIVDLAALAAAEQIGLSGDPCGAARRVASANAAVVSTCSVRRDPSMRSGTVAIIIFRDVHLPIAGTARAWAHARAARMPP